jgi:hypothetical protein
MRIGAAASSAGTSTSLHADSLAGPMRALKQAFEAKNAAPRSAEPGVSRIAARIVKGGACVFAFLARGHRPDMIGKKVAGPTGMPPPGTCVLGKRW